METMNVTTNSAELVMIPREEYDAMKAYIAELESKLNWLTEQVRLSRVRRFGASSEAAGQEVLEQMSLLFNEAEFHAYEAGKAAFRRVPGVGRRPDGRAEVQTQSGVRLSFQSVDAPDELPAGRAA